MTWYYEHNGAQAGPVSDSEFEALVQTGQIRNRTLVWQAGMANWQPYSEVQEARGRLNAAPQAPAASPPQAPANSSSQAPSASAVSPAPSSYTEDTTTESTQSTGFTPSINPAPTAPAYSPHAAYNTQAPAFTSAAPQTAPQQAAPFHPTGVPSLQVSPAFQVQPVIYPGFENAILCSTCRRPFPHEDLLFMFNKALCPVCKPIYVQRIQEGLEAISKSPFDAMAYATFGRRFVAKLLDVIFLSITGMIQYPLLIMTLQSNPAIHTTLTIFSWIFNLAIGAAYTTFFLGRFQATPGKLIMRIKVIRSDGSRITYWRALGRHFSEIISQVFLYMGYIVAAFDDERRTWHDRIVDTRVVDKDAV